MPASFFLRYTWLALLVAAEDNADMVQNSLAPTRRHYDTNTTLVDKVSATLVTRAVDQVVDEFYHHHARDGSTGAARTCTAVCRTLLVCYYDESCDDGDLTQSVVHTRATFGSNLKYRVNDRTSDGQYRVSLCPNAPDCYFMGAAEAPSTTAGVLSAGQTANDLWSDSGFGQAIVNAANASEVFVWGSQSGSVNPYSLGLGDTGCSAGSFCGTSHIMPHAAGTLTFERPVISIALCQGFGCAVLDDNTLWCWGKEVTGNRRFDGCANAPPGREDDSVRCENGWVKTPAKIDYMSGSLRVDCLVEGTAVVMTNGTIMATQSSVGLTNMNPPRGFRRLKSYPGESAVADDAAEEGQTRAKENCCYGEDVSAIRLATSSSIFAIARGGKMHSWGNCQYIGRDTINAATDPYPGTPCGSTTGHTSHSAHYPQAVNGTDHAKYEGQNRPDGLEYSVAFDTSVQLKAIDAGGWNICGVFSDRWVKCFGDSNSGFQAGRRRNAHGSWRTEKTVPSIGIMNMIQIPEADVDTAMLAVAYSGFCVTIQQNTAIRCWGWGPGNDNIEGSEASQNVDTPWEPDLPSSAKLGWVPGKVGDLVVGGTIARISAASSNLDRICFILTDNTCKCWRPTACDDADEKPCIFNSTFAMSKFADLECPYGTLVGSAPPSVASTPAVDWQYSVAYGGNEGSGRAYILMLDRTDRKIVYMGHASGATYNREGNLGIGETRNPHGGRWNRVGGGDFSFPADVVSMATCEAFSCAVLSNGHLWCWGEETSSWRRFGGERRGEASGREAYWSPQRIEIAPPGLKYYACKVDGSIVIDADNNIWATPGSTNLAKDNGGPPNKGGFRLLLQRMNPNDLPGTRNALDNGGSSTGEQGLAYGGSREPQENCCNGQGEITAVAVTQSGSAQCVIVGEVVKCWGGCKWNGWCKTLDYEGSPRVCAEELAPVRTPCSTVHDNNGNQNLRDPTRQTSYYLQPVFPTSMKAHRLVASAWNMCATMSDDWVYCWGIGGFSGAAGSFRGPEKYIKLGDKDAATTDDYKEALLASSGYMVCAGVGSKLRCYGNDNQLQRTYNPTTHMPLHLQSAANRDSQSIRVDEAEADFALSSPAHEYDFGTKIASLHMNWYDTGLVFTLEEAEAGAQPCKSLRFRWSNRDCPSTANMWPGHACPQCEAATQFTAWEPA